MTEIVNKSTPSKENKKPWAQPWGYIESFSIGVGLVIIGFVIEIFAGGSIRPLVFPANAIVAVVYVNLLVILYAFFQKTTFVRWLSSVPAAVSSMCMMTFMVLLLGFTMQSDEKIGLIAKLGLNRLISSWPFLLAQVYLVTTLGLVTLKRIIPFRWRNFGFFLNHAGLFLVLIAASLGYGDMQRYSMNLQQGQDFNNLAADKNGQYQLRLGLKLMKFTIEEYPPKILLAETATGNVIDKKGKTFVQSYQGTKGMVGDWNVFVEKYLESAIHDSILIYKAQEQIGASHAAFVKAWKTGQNDTIKGWISCGSYTMEYRPLQLDPTYSLGMANPETKKYSSIVQYVTAEGAQGTINLEVNKPAKVGNWKLYQSGYDPAMGKYSQTSIIELINDPWLPIVYIGFFMMLAGAIYIFWIGRNTKDLPSTENLTN